MRICSLFRLFRIKMSFEDCGVDFSHLCPISKKGSLSLSIDGFKRKDSKGYQAKTETSFICT